ncbi:HEPN domain-containing protein [Pyrococcus horikoshii]|uniref:UPF0332 protein PH1297 n=1 Tax=Pyrococcus horikoshii (strain ATCC 700860 / DSM 12428 / JCM 9974 / NBRC 100139 / OT-3) TaxID=70601 RepID=Y1297_PYRHO|nr:HEPN domain-containing protein [Pyrococcus horikoshii]O59008.1 RecName: Full=UPF0332 protein PH1297 [Pyrococcus horikoshii OT3]BAA30401.1 142aa long hypothetical protein [Pyrococcus horikoshii OT3]
MDVPEEVEKHIKITEEELSSAYLLLENGKLRDSISRAYYSMFHAAKALLLLKGIDPRKHSGVIRMFGLHFVNSGFIERVYAKYLTHSRSDQRLTMMSITNQVMRKLKTLLKVLSASWRELKVFWRRLKMDKKAQALNEFLKL